MPDASSALEAIAAGRREDPLAPVTVIVPSHVAGLQMRRRLAEITPFAGVRFETLPRIAELLAAGHLAAAGRSPLARPIGDYVAEEVARESRGTLARLADLPGYARTLRQMFRRLRRGGIHSSDEVSVPPDSGHLGEVLRLFDLFRDRTRGFYDDEDLLEEAASVLRAGKGGALQDLGALYVMPPGALSAGGVDLLAALQEASPAYEVVHEAAVFPETRFVLSPDPASEAREVAREVLGALDEGVPVQEIAVFHGADASYRRLLREAFASAGIPVAPLPGVPLSETAAGRGVLMLLSLPEEDYRRSAVLDFLGVAPLRDWLPGRGDAKVLRREASWDRISRDAGVTRGGEVWRQRLSAKMDDLAAALAGEDPLEHPERVQAMEWQREAAAELLTVVEGLVERLEGLREPRPAAEFISGFKAIVREYFDPSARWLEEGPGGSAVMREIDQLGTVASVGGSFGLAAFGFALRANLDAAYGRETNFGEGVIVADYRAAAGLQFRRVVLCGAYEGALPAGPGGDAIIGDATWARLRERHPFVEDAALRMERARQAAQRAVSSAREVLVWSSPLNEPGGVREYYPSPLMVKAASDRDPEITTATGLRHTAARSGWLRRGHSPLAVMVRGPALDRAELQVRSAILLKRGGGADPGHPRFRALELLRGRRSARFTEWDGNLHGLPHPAWLDLQSAVSPTSLEAYAACGFRYLCRSLLKLNVVEEPEEREMMDAAARGTLIHTVLERFFVDVRKMGRPAPGEAWDDADRERLLAIAAEELARARARGQTGLEVYGRHEERTIRADLVRFLDADTEFRAETGAVPSLLEYEIPETQVAGVRLRGRVDRIDITPDGKQAWVIDYKTGGGWEFDKWKVEEDPFQRGRKLQLGAYLAAVPEVERPRALYWFITRRGQFKRVEYVPTPASREVFRRTIEAIVQGIRSGAFPAVSGDEDDYRGGYENCNFCDYDRICSRRRDQEYATKVADEEMAPWRRVEEAAKPEESA